MLSKIYEIRRLTIRLEDNVKMGSYQDLMENSFKIQTIAEELREQFKKENAHIVKKFELAQNNDFKRKEINQLDFVYKPISTRNVFEGSYIERYSEERTLQLTSSGALNSHNSFWSAYDTVYGTVFGSVPTELIGSSSTAMLLQLGWEHAKVKVIEFGDVTSREAIVDYCSAVYKDYIIVKEKKTGSYLVLSFII